MKNYNTILTEKLNIYKISTLLSGKSHKCVDVTGEQLLRSAEKRMIEQAKFTYSPLRKTLEKQTRTIEDKSRK